MIESIMVCFVWNMLIVSYLVKHSQIYTVFNVYLYCVNQLTVNNYTKYIKAMAHAFKSFKLADVHLIK